MTEAEWWNCRGAVGRLKAIWPRLTPRKSRLFAVGCCYHIWGYMTDERSRNAVRIAEMFVDGEATEEELVAAYEAACQAVEDAEGSDARDVAAAAVAASDPERPEPLLASDCARLGVGDAVREAELALVVELFGNPYRTAVIDPCWLTWNDGTVRRMAEGIYCDRAFDRLPLLADALLDAGCDNENILSHCRRPDGHIRGCWVLDALLGKS